MLPCHMGRREMAWRGMEGPLTAAAAAAATGGRASPDPSYLVTGCHRLSSLLRRLCMVSRSRCNAINEHAYSDNARRASSVFWLIQAAGYRCRPAAALPSWGCWGECLELGRAVIHFLPVGLGLRNIMPVLVGGGWRGADMSASGVTPAGELAPNLCRDYHWAAEQPGGVTFPPAP